MGCNSNERYEIVPMYLSLGVMQSSAGAAAPQSRAAVQRLRDVAMFLSITASGLA